MTKKSIHKSPLLEALFTSQARVEVLKLLFLRSSRPHYVREIASLTDQPVRAVQRELARLERVGILLSNPEGNRKYFQANRDSPIYPELRSLLMKTIGIGGVMRERLGGEDEAIRLAFIFGSFAQGTENVTSDIDLLVVGDITNRDLSRLLAPAKELLGREINPIVISANELRRKIYAEDNFFQRVIRDPKIFVKGGNDELRQLVD